MDYVQFLAKEAQKAHPIFHEYLLSLTRATPQTRYFFFEGDEDPAFYTGFILSRKPELMYHSFICDGRSEVIKVNRLIAQDGRETDKCLYFIDKDHTDIMGEGKEGNAFFQTIHYSFENYLVCEGLLRRFWRERLHLSYLDERFEKFLSTFQHIYTAFLKRMRLLMALVLVGRGIDGHKKIKLNLNNVDLDSVVQIDLVNGTCRYIRGISQYLLKTVIHKEQWSMNSGAELRRVYRIHLSSREFKSYVRGKYELWFLWKFLTLTTRELSDREKARKMGLNRATPKSPLPLESCVESLSSLIGCPSDLSHFLQINLSDT